jgi:MFS family permease
LLFIVVVLSFVDRTNLAFASLQMNADLHISPAAYGVAAGTAFFLPYAASQLPSSLMLVRFGAPRWLAAITLLWGACAAGMAAVRQPWQFLLLRFLLGLCESGAIPGECRSPRFQSTPQSTRRSQR